MSVDDVDDECERFLDQAASNFYFKYTSYLGRYGALQGECEITLNATLSAARAQGHKLFLSIDSYTAPTRYSSPGLMRLLGENIFNRMTRSIRSGLIRCGAMFGDTVPYSVPPWAGNSQYDRYTNDLTDDPAFTCAVGFTRDEIESLGQALSIKLASRIAPACPDGHEDADLPSPTVYCAADVLSAAHSLLTDDTLDIGRQNIAIYPAMPEPASSDSDESMDSDYYFPLKDNELQDAPPDDTNAPPPENATAPSPEARYLDGADYETLTYAFAGSKYPNAKPPADMDLEELARISAAAHATDTSPMQGSTLTMSASVDSEASQPPAIPAEGRSIRP